MSPKASRRRRRSRLVRRRVAEPDQPTSRAGSLGSTDQVAGVGGRMEPAVHLTTDRPALPARLMAALLYPKHMYALSDDDVGEGWRENPYGQRSRGERYFQLELPCDASRLVRWRHALARPAVNGGGAQRRDCLQGQRLQASEPGRGAVGHHRTAQGDCTPGRQPLAQTGLRATRRCGTRRRHHAAPDLCLRSKAAETRPAATHMPSSSAACVARSGSCAPISAA